MIHLHYSAIFELLAKPKDQLTIEEKDIMINYQYCTNMLEDIEDQGDVYLFANELENSKLYYANKITNKEDDGKYYYKLANVQQQCGQLEEADKNVKKSLEIELTQLDTQDREKCLKVFSIHSKNAEIKANE